MQHTREVLPDEIDEDPPEYCNSFGAPLPPAVLRRNEPDALHHSWVMPDEIDEDPPAGRPIPGGLKTLLEAFVTLCKAGNKPGAEMVLLALFADEDMGAEMIFAAAAHCGVAVPLS